MWTLGEKKKKKKVAERIIGLGERKEMKCGNAMIKTDALPGRQLRPLRKGKNRFLLIRS